MMSEKDFKHFLDRIIEMAFKEGVAWKQNSDDLMPMEDAIKKVQEIILGE